MVAIVAILPLRRTIPAGVEHTFVQMAFQEAAISGCEVNRGKLEKEVGETRESPEVNAKNCPEPQTLSSLGTKRFHDSLYHVTDVQMVIATITRASMGKVLFFLMFLMFLGLGGFL